MVLVWFGDRDHHCCSPVTTHEENPQRSISCSWSFLGSSMCPQGDVWADCCGSHQVQVHRVWPWWLTASNLSITKVCCRLQCCLVNHQSISRHGISCVRQTTYIVVPDLISSTWVKANPRDDPNCEYIFSALVQIMACRLVSAKPLSEPMFAIFKEFSMVRVDDGYGTFTMKHQNKLALT